MALFLLAGLAVGLIYYLVTAVASVFRLRAFPGPRLSSFSYFWMLRNTFSGRQGDIYYREASMRYGDIVRIGPRELITSDPQLIRRLSATRSAAQQYHRSSWYALNRIDPYEDSMFSLRDDAAHDGLKARTAAAYAGRENPALEPEVDTVLRELVAVLRATARGQAQQSDTDAKAGQADSDGPYSGTVPVGPGFGRPGSATAPRPETVRAPAADLAVLAQYFTLDSITRVAFGRAFGFLARQEDVHSYLQSIRGIAPYTIACTEVPYLTRIMASPTVLKLVGPKHSDEKGIGCLMRVAREIVAERFAPDAKDRRDMLGAFVRNGLTQRQCETEALFQIVAGSDSTATAIRMILLYVMVTPRVYRRLQAEIDAAQHLIPCETSVDGVALPSVTPNAVAKCLPYLQAVIWEGLRMHPPFVGLPFKEVPAHGDTINGHFVPSGTRIAPSYWALMRRSEVFGDDVDVFRPERWLPGENETPKDVEARADMRRTVELVFGYGRWACAGKTLAFLEINKTVAELMRQFDLQLVNVLKPLTSVNFNLFMQSNMWVRVTEREPALAGQ